MVGREVLFLVDKKKSQPGEVVLSVDQLSAENDRGLPALRDVSLQVHAGEILGIAGVAGNGQRELAEKLTRVGQPPSGKKLFSNMALGAHTDWMEVRQRH